MVDFNEKQELFLFKQLIEQSADLMLVVNTDSRFMYANYIAAHLFGYHEIEQIHSLTAHAIRCPASEFAEQFIAQDQQVIQQQRPLSLLDIHTYANDIPKVFLTKKSPLYDNNQNIFAVLCHCREISTDTFQKFSMTIASAERRFYSKNKSTERCYEITSVDNTLSKRELECLFFLLRGKTAAQIADILFLSKRTVENHLANIKTKLGCNKKSELIDVGIMNGYLNIIPESLLRKDLSLVLSAD